MFPVLREVVDETRLVEEEDVVSAIRRLALGNRLIVEPSAALSVAAALAAAEDRRGPSVCLVTGGSIDTERLVEILG
jgi:threonine dehydratase